jgi:hypothetical protein
MAHRRADGMIGARPDRFHYHRNPTLWVGSETVALPDPLSGFKSEAGNFYSDRLNAFKALRFCSKRFISAFRFFLFGLSFLFRILFVCCALDAISFSPILLVQRTTKYTMTLPLCQLLGAHSREKQEEEEKLKLGEREGRYVRP